MGGEMSLINGVKLAIGHVSFISHIGFLGGIAY